MGLIPGWIKNTTKLVFSPSWVYLYRKWLYVIYVEKVATAVINVLAQYVTTVINQVMWHLIVLVPEDHGV
jgi:hypothetical protein